MSVTDTSSVVLNCSVLGAPKETVVWKKNGKPVVFNNRIEVLNDNSFHSLHIKQLKPEDKGIYVSKHISIKYEKNLNHCVFQLFFITKDSVYKLYIKLKLQFTSFYL